MIKYFIYSRKSSEEEERQILSIEAQQTELREYAKQNNLIVAKEFAESQSAKEPGRPIFNKMVEEIEKGNAQGILAWNPDRLARNSIDGGRIIYLVDTEKIQSLKFLERCLWPSQILHRQFTRKHFARDTTKNQARWIIGKSSIGIFQWATTSHDWTRPQNIQKSKNNFGSFCHRSIYAYRHSAQNVFSWLGWQRRQTASSFLDSAYSW